MDKARQHVASELEDLNLDLEKVRELGQDRPDILCCLFFIFSQERNRGMALEKKQKQVDKQITEWKSKCDGKQAELDQANRVNHAQGTEV